MKVITYEGVVENGCVHIPAGVSLPEKAKVYVVVPGVYESGVRRAVHVPGPRLAHPEQASDFVKEVLEIKERTDADV
jgi:hypothetical protein